MCVGVWMNEWLRIGIHFQKERESLRIKAKERINLGIHGSYKTLVLGVV